MRRSALARLAVMAILLACLMVPLTMVQGVVSERAARRAEATADISSIWGGVQTLGGPVLTVPYRYTWIDQNGRAKPAVGHAHFLPQRLEIDGAVDPEVRRRGLFEVVVFRSRLTVKGRFAPPDFTGIRPAPDQIQWDGATLSLGVTDPKGISRGITLKVNGAERRFTPGVELVGLFASGVRAPVTGLSATSGPLECALEIELNGTRQLRFMPGGDETTVALASTWPHPSFAGAPLPLSRDVRANGFTATWRAPFFGRGYAPRWASTEMNAEQLKAHGEASAFGVILLQPVDIYQQAERAVKYGALFIVLTFVIAFLWEIVQGSRLHPIQYLFVGFAMCVFYLLLLSLSEHIGFDRAYLTAATATIALLSWYWSRIVKGARHGVSMAATLAGLYGYLYLLLRLEDYALLAGSLGLFAMLATVMYLTRRVDWYDLRLGAADRPDRGAAS
jgi:inner membrane protein